MNKWILPNCMFWFGVILNQALIRLQNQIYGTCGGMFCDTTNLQIVSHWFIGIGLLWTLKIFYKRYRDETSIKNDICN